MALRLIYTIMGKWKPEYDNKRKLIRFSFNFTEMELFQKKYGVLPTGHLVKKIVLNKAIEITSKVIDTSKNETNFQLKKLGNNMNQIAWHLNTNPNLLSSSDHKKLLYTIQELEKTLQTICE